MKPFPSILLLHFLAAILPAAAQGPGGGPPPDGGMNRAPKLTRGQEIKIYLTLDTNGDGKLTRDEVPARGQGIFTRADLDHDDVITTAELTAMVEKRFAALASRGEGRGGPPPGGGRPPGPPPTGHDP